MDVRVDNIDPLKLIATFVAENDYYRTLLKEKDRQIEYLENTKGLTEKRAAEKAFINVHKELVKKHEDLQCCAHELTNMLLDAGGLSEQAYRAIDNLRKEFKP